ncbi:phage head spike fiber domain-containing protein [Polymorphum gilvum]|uniref:Uncharacterized protein n=1 Tax=Polymorphum gilvum (strain LMG 25793 / CGMCC 1.9160 / SL003B-26A1) TaxID=991905 RepID=F2J640_POLGS|nr:hypothetical protein [Polymorphum gilvum]ADZ72404.1 hypothetical protein SL003B_3984 [Polymorphum gilvum SL003B-26A1]
MSRINEFRTAVEATFTAALPVLRSCAVQFGRFDLDELQRNTIRAPALRIGVIRAPVQASAGGSYDVGLEIAAFAIAEGKEPGRDADAWAIAEAVLAVLSPRQRFGLARIGAPQGLRIAPLISGQFDRRGVSVVAVEWTQALREVTAGVFAEGEPIELTLDVNGAPFWPPPPDDTLPDDSLPEDGRPAWVPAGAAFYLNALADRAWINGRAYAALEDLIASPDADFARPTVGTGVVDGALVTFALNTPRLTDGGLLIEDASTNLILTSTDVREGTGWLGWWNQPSLANLTGGIADPFGGNGAVRWNAAATSGSGSGIRGGRIAVNAGALADQTEVTSSMWVRASDAYSSFLFSVNSVGVGNTGLTTTWTRKTHTANYRTGSSAAADERVILFGDESNENVNIDVFGPQCEPGNKATSYIPTTGSSATRAADALTLAVEDGTYDVTVTFDDDSTQTLSVIVVDGGGWGVPTDLDRPHIKTILGVATSGGGA